MKIERDTDRLAAATRLCRHCGTALPPAPDSDYCCNGCAAAHDLIEGMGLDLYYRRRVLDPLARAPRPDSTQPAARFAPFVGSDAKGVRHLYLTVDGLQCAACVWLIEQVLARQPDLLAGRVNMTTRRLHLAWRGPVERAEALAGLVAGLGYRLSPYDASTAGANGADRALLRALAVAGFAAANVMLLSVAVWAGHSQGMGAATRDLLHWVSALIALPAIAYSGRPFFRSAMAALRHGRANMDVPISIGVVLAAGMSLFETMTGGEYAYFDSAIALLFFLLVGRYLEERARARARLAVGHLLALQNATVSAIEDDGSIRVSRAGDVAKGKLVLVAAGERIGVDGEIVSGRSAVDMALVTGESLPVPVAPGAVVFSGTVNLDAALTVRTRATGEETLLAEIVRLTEAAEHGRGTFVTLAERVSRLYAPVVHVTAAATFLGWVTIGGLAWQPALLIAVSVLIITCPCALALAVPVTQVVAHGRLMRRGILVKSATALERLRQVDTIVFDKTGTLTTGRPELMADATLDRAALQQAASLAQSSRHPLSQALLRAARGPVAVLEGVVEHPGQGLAYTSAAGTMRLGSRAFAGPAQAPSTVGPELWFAAPGKAPLQFRFADALRPDAADVVKQLKERGFQVAIVSGDRAATVGDLARRLGIEEWHAGVDPAGKAGLLAERARLGQRVLMVGDGMNDAPALAAAHLSVSPSTALDIAQAAADIVFQGDRLQPLLDILDMGRRAARIMRQNMAAALVYNLAAVPLAVAGFVTPLVAAVSMSGSSIVVIANALRLNLRNGRRG